MKIVQYGNKISIMRTTNMAYATDREIIVCYIRNIRYILKSHIDETIDGRRHAYTEEEANHNIQSYFNCAINIMSDRFPRKKKLIKILQKFRRKYRLDGTLNI